MRSPTSTDTNSSTVTSNPAISSPALVDPTPVGRVYLIDYSLAKWYVDPTTSKHIPKGPIPALAAETYASLHVHYHRTLAQRRPRVPRVFCPAAAPRVSAVARCQKRRTGARKGPMDWLGALRGLSPSLRRVSGIRAGCSSMKGRTTSVGEIGFVLWCPTGRRSHCYTTLPAHHCLWSDRLWAVTVLSIRLAPLLHLKRATTRYRTATTGGVPPHLGQRPRVKVEDLLGDEQGILAGALEKSDEPPSMDTPYLHRCGDHVEACANT